MRIDIITLFPEMMESSFNYSIMKRARHKGKLNTHVYNLRHWSKSKHGQVDDTQYGGGAGMVLMCEPLAEAIEDLSSQYKYNDIIYVTPDGEPFQQSMANILSTSESLLFICGHYKGIDERIREHYITREISIGDYVLTGGELAVAVIADALVRLIPGVLNDESSALDDSFQDGLLSYPVYTRPSDYKGWKVPEVLQSGHFAKIEEWRIQQSIERTKVRRPDLYRKFSDSI